MQDILDTLSVERIVEMALTFFPKALAAALVVFAFWLLYRVTRPPLRTMLSRADFADALVKLLVDNVYKIVVVGIGLVMAASQLGFNVGAALAGLGVAGIAVGFAAQESVANTIAGFLIFWDKPFQVGHYITTQGEYGRVSNITMRTTRIQTRNNTYVVIPNRKIIEDVLVNHSMYGKTRVDVPVGIAYKEDIAAARKVLLDAAKSVDGVMSDPSPVIAVVELGGSSVNLDVRVWISDAAREKPIFVDVLEACKVALDQANIEIPFPHLQLFVDDVKKPVIDKLTAVVG